MNHDIAHCTGLKYADKCKNCYRRKAHEDLQRLVNRGKSVTGGMYQYVNAEECEDNDYNLYWAEEYAGHIHDETDAIPSRP